MVIRCVGLINKLLTDPPGALCSPTQLYATWSFNMEASSNQMASLTVFGCSRAFPFCICYETMYKRPDVATVNGRCRRAPLRIESLSGRRMIKDPLIRFCPDPTCSAIGTNVIIYPGRTQAQKHTPQPAITRPRQGSSHHTNTKRPTSPPAVAADGQAQDGPSYPPL